MRRKVTRNHVVFVLICGLCLLLLGPAANAETEKKDEQASDLKDDNNDKESSKNQESSEYQELKASVQKLEEKMAEMEKDAATQDKMEKFIKAFKFSTVWYLHYRYGHRANDSKNLSAGYDNYNMFNIGRGYLTMKVTPLSWFHARITMDAHQDEEGDMKVRLKYLYGKFIVPVETKVLSEPSLEFGQAHGPWLDYEEHINWYRCQGTMFMERNKLFNSADFGFTAGVLLGRKLDGEYVEKVSKKYPGSWGSIALGIYNGGGYHALEENNNKTFEGRLSVRPAGPFFPNIQLSYFTIYGRGNIEETADWNPPLWQSHAVMASFEHEYLALTGQFVTGKGNQKGNFVDWTTETDPDTNEEINTGIANVHEYLGASGFLEVKLPWIRSSLIGRYDWFDREDLQTQRVIGGYAFHFLKQHKNFVMLDVDYVIPDDSIPDAESSWEVKLTLQIKL